METGPRSCACGDGISHKPNGLNDPGAEHVCSTPELMPGYLRWIKLRTESIGMVEKGERSCGQARRRAAMMQNARIYCKTHAWRHCIAIYCNYFDLPFATDDADGRVFRS